MPQVPRTRGPGSRIKPGAGAPSLRSFIAKGWVQQTAGAPSIPRSSRNAWEPTIYGCPVLATFLFLWLGWETRTLRTPSSPRSSRNGWVTTTAGAPGPSHLGTWESIKPDLTCLGLPKIPVPINSALFAECVGTDNLRVPHPCDVFVSRRKGGSRHTPPTSLLFPRDLLIRGILDENRRPRSKIERDRLQSSRMKRNL